MSEKLFVGIKRREENGTEHITLNNSNDPGQGIVIFSETSVFTKGYFAPEEKKAVVEKALKEFSAAPLNAPRSVCVQF